MQKNILTVFLLLLSWVACRKEQAQVEISAPLPYPLEIPKGMPQMQIPADNPLTVEGVALGRKLFYDPILSGDRTQSCSSCHRQEAAFSDAGKRFSVGIKGLNGSRNAHAIINTGFLSRLFWDGRALGLEAQILEPVPNPLEMNLSWKEAGVRLNADESYRKEFFQAFGINTIDSTFVAKAIAQFLRTLISADSRFDKRLRNELNLSAEELNGYVIFNTERGDCFHCHPADGGRLFTDNRFHNNGLDSVFTDKGLFSISGNPADMGKFLTPTLRNIAFTAPYMHDGRFATLEEVIEHYNRGGIASPSTDPLMKNVGKGLNLTAKEKADLLAFLHALSDSNFVKNKNFSSPF
ncbi:MAG: cytochrome-c peroxidase [Bacteroidia bacterium]|nr:cytochrome-c peroxidase [Bacteroidia bacterium]MCC6769288.1 cytochrome-c peroxidase [Bacteroidia bacterium]